MVSVPNLGPMGDMVLTVRHGDDVDPERNRLLEQLLIQERVVRLASAFVHSVPGWFERGIAETVDELSAMPWVTRVSIWVLVGDRFQRRALWESPEMPSAPPLPWSLPMEALPWPAGFRGGEGVGPRDISGTTLSDLVAGWQDDAADLTAHPMRKLLAAPLVHGGAVIGFFLMESTRDDGEFDASHVTAMRIAAAVTAEAMVRQDAERELEERARTDRLTGLPNRWSFRQALDEALATLAAADAASTTAPDDLAQLLTRERRPRPAGLGVALIDIDRFKLVNDLLGHDTGDQVLMAVSERFATSATLLHPRALVARLSGDEFLLLHPECSSLREIADGAHELLRSLDPPLYVDGHPVTITAAAGVVHARDGSSESVELLRRVDLAMYRAKGSGGDCIMGDDARVRTEVAERITEEAALREAIEGEGLEVYMQGEWNLRDGSLLGGEALVRWHHPKRGLLPASDFVPLAEDTGLINDLGRRVMREACTALSDWRRRGLASNFVLRVNLSAQQLRSPELLDDVRNLLSDTGLPAEALCVELTESSLLGDPEGAASTLRRVRDLGVGLSVDDFGTGYSSLLYLKALPLTSIKIDQAFVAGLPHHESDRAIVAAVVQLARAFAIDVVAEGVETAEQRQALLDMGCTWGQGYLLSKPEPLDIFGDRLVNSLG
jgi:diguanylate cyclase (GGDEF)-like protein